MIGGRRRDGRKTPGGPGDGKPRVHGAWTTPAVVVRGPDGRVVDGSGAGGGAVDRSGLDGGAPDEPGAGERVAEKRPRVRPRRIPGAPGAVLLTPTLVSGAADDREERRRRRRDAPVASVTLMPARRRAAASTDDGDDDSNGDASASGGSGAVAAGGSSAPGERGPVRRALRPVKDTAPARRSRRVAEALAGLNFDRLLPPDEEARARRALRLRRCALVLAAVALVTVLVYSVFPVRTWIDQRADADRAREQQEVIEAENERLEQEAADLRTRERIEELARELGLVMPGEELYGIMPGPEAPAEQTETTEPPG